jgi:hypothetical protein
VRSLWVVSLPALPITRAGIQALLVSAIQLNLIVSAVIPIAPIAAILTIVAILAVVIDAIITVLVLIASPITLVVTLAIIAMPASPRLPIPVITITVAITVLLTTLIIAIIIAILRLSDTAGRGKYPKNKCERQKSPAYPFSIIFHSCKSPLRVEGGKLYASEVIMRDRLICGLKLADRIRSRSHIVHRYPQMKHALVKSDE